MTKVILLNDVPGTGKKYDIKDVSDGFYRNCLLPKKLAEIATPKATATVEKRKKEQEQAKQLLKDLAEKGSAKLNGIKVSISEKANEKGHLFAAVHKEEIVKILEKEKGIKIPEDMIEMDKPIKEIGKHEIKVGKSMFVLEVEALI